MTDSHTGPRRPGWHSIPEPIRRHVATTLGSEVASFDAVSGGFSSGAAGVCTLADGRRYFAKAAELDTTMSHELIRREARIVAALGRVSVQVPPIHYFYEDDDWTVLITEAIEGVHPTTDLDHARAVLDALVQLPSADQVTLKLESAAGDFAQTALNWQDLEELGTDRLSDIGVPPFVITHFDLLNELA